MSSTISMEQRAAIAEKAVGEISHIATLPEITLRIIDLVEDPSATAQDLHKLISNDPALCSRILKVVNSAFYGLPGQIGSINRAIVLLGLNAVKNIAIATSLAKLFRGGELCPKFGARDLWVHSTAVATTAKLIADHAHPSIGDEAFLAGLLHDIGLMVQMQVDRHRLVEVFERSAAEPFIDAEDAVFGANHQDFGRALCQRWKFPRSFANVAGFHHRPQELEPGSRLLTSIVYIADRIAFGKKLGFTADLQSDEIDRAILSEVRLDAPALQAVMQAFPDAFADVESIFG